MQQQHLPSESAGLRVYAASCSDTGRVRWQNEDAVALCEAPDQQRLTSLGRLYLLADGAGGHVAGEVASNLAVETIASVYYQQETSAEERGSPLQTLGELVHLDGPLADFDLPCRQIAQAFGSAHRRIRELAAARYDYNGMMTTCLAAVVKGRHLLIAHIGDSRAYLLRSASGPQPAITCLTTDHSMATALAKAGVMTADQMRSSPSRHILIRALGEGTNNWAGPDITTCLVQSGDALVLCCDGLWSMLPEEQIALVVNAHAPQAACHELVRLANEAGGDDNISVVVLSFA